jgi:hypothetical protein
VVVAPAVHVTLPVCTEVDDATTANPVQAVGAPAVAVSPNAVEADAVAVGAVRMVTGNGMGHTTAEVVVA